MIKTLRISFSLRNTYRVNSILYSIRQIPLIKNIFLETIYRMQGFKVLANVLSVFGEIISAFLGKILYFLLMMKYHLQTFLLFHLLFCYLVLSRFFFRLFYS